MKLQLNRFLIMVKRSLKQPVNLAMLLTLVVLAVIYRQIPAVEKSLYVPVAILCEDQSPDMQDVAKELVEMNSIFHFYLVDSRDAMYEDIADKKANSGFVIPEGFYDRVTDASADVKIILYTSPSSLFPSLCRDEFFNVLFKKIALQNAKKMAEDQETFAGLDTSSVTSELDKTYDYFQSSTEIFRVEDSTGGVYNELTREEKTDIPIRKLSGLFIFAAAMIGIATYLKDAEERLYTRLRGSERQIMRMYHIISAVLPMAVISIPVILITEGGNPLTLIVHILLYTLACIAYSLLFSLVLRSSAVYQKVLPLVLTLAIILGGVIFDVTQFEKSMKIISMLFPPYYF